MNLNESQSEVASWKGGPILALAGAGAGKTATLAITVRNLINSGVPSRAILVQTYTKKAGMELRERIAKQVGEEAARDLFAGTFHSFCWGVMTSEIAEFKNKKVEHVKLADYKATQFLEEALKEELLELHAQGVKDLPPQEDVPQVLKRFSLAKCNLIFPSDEVNAIQYFGAILGEAEGQRMAKIYKSYCLKVRKAGLVDFDDWLLIVYRLMQHVPDVLARYQDRYRYILSDEVQDQNLAQNEILKLIAGERGNLFLVGDVKQSVYSFRGSRPDATILSFEEAFPGGKIVYLRENYRCDGHIITCANNITQHMDIPEKYRSNLIATKEAVNMPEVHACAMSDEEGLLAAAKIADHIAAGVELSEIAILYRTNAQSIYPEQALIQAGIPYVIIGGDSFYERREVLDLVAYLELVSNSNTIAASDACKRVINYASRRYTNTHRDRNGKPLSTHMCGQAFIKGLIALARSRNAQCMEVLKEYSEHKDAWPNQREGVADFFSIVNRMRRMQEAGDGPADIIRWVFDDVYSNYLENSKSDESELEDGRAENCRQLIADLARYNSVASALGHIRQLRDQAQRNKTENNNTVKLMSLHGSKGLEFKHTFLIGWNEGTLPHSRGDVQEERRLAYVGITRAKVSATITWVESKGDPSRFIGELGIPGYGDEDYEAEDDGMDPRLDFLLGDNFEDDESDGRLAFLEDEEETSNEVAGVWINPMFA